MQGAADKYTPGRAVRPMQWAADKDTPGLMKGKRPGVFAGIQGGLIPIQRGMILFR